MHRSTACTCHTSDGTTDQKSEVTVLEKSEIRNTEGFSAELNSSHSPSDLKKESEEEKKNQLAG